MSFTVLKYGFVIIIIIIIIIIIRRGYFTKILLF